MFYRIQLVKYCVLSCKFFCLLYYFFLTLNQFAYWEKRMGSPVRKADLCLFQQFICARGILGYFRLLLLAIKITIKEGIFERVRQLFHNLSTVLCGLQICFAPSKNDKATDELMCIHLLFRFSGQAGD